MSQEKRWTLDVIETDKGLKLELTGALVKECLANLLTCCRKGAASGKR